MSDQKSIYSNLSSEIKSWLNNGLPITIVSKEVLEKYGLNKNSSNGSVSDSRNNVVNNAVNNK